MRPSHSSPLRATLRIVLLALSILTVFGITAMICAVPLYLFQNRLHASAGIVSLGILCGLIAWLFVASFHIRKESLTLLYEERDSFLTRLQQELEELGYEAGEQQGEKRIFKPGFTSYLVGGVIRVQEYRGGVIITGPKVFVEMLRKRMKIHHHISSLQQNITESRARQGRHLLRRVEIDLRVSATQWQQIYDDVISLLEGKETEIVCEVHILAQNESGILDTTVENLIRERLRRENIPAEIRKEGRSSAEHKVLNSTPI